MSVFLDMLTIVSPIFLTIAVGFAAARIGLVDKSFTAGANRLFYFVALPLLLFYTIGNADFAQSFDLPQVAGAVLGFCSLLAIALAATSRLRVDPGQRGAFCQAAIRGNMAYIGLAVVYSAYGQQGLSRTGFLFGVLVGLLNLLSILALVLPQRGRLGQRTSTLVIRQVLANPLVMAAAAGLVWSATGWGMPRVMDETLSIISRMTLPLALLVIGAEFTWEELKGDLGLAAAASAGKLLLAPALIGGFAALLGARSMELGVAVVLAASPTSSASYVLTGQLGGDKALARSSVMLSTLASVFTFTLVLTVLELAGR
jgi:predicted permease